MYKENGKLVTGWKKIDGKWYYFETNGVMQTGWVKDSGKWYYLRNNGEMAASQWRQDPLSKKWYYLKGNGEMAKSQMRKGTDGNSYYLGADGPMLTDADIVWEGKEYRADSAGKCELVKKEADSVEEKIEKFMQATEEMGNWYVSNINTYQNDPKGEGTGTRKYYTYPPLGIKVGDDCSAFVSVCLHKAGIISKWDYSTYSFNKNLKGKDNGLIQQLELSNFVWHTYDDNYVPQRGDISVQHNNVHHIEIIDSVSNGQVRIWPWGTIYKQLPTTRGESTLRKRMSGYWRIER